MKEIQCCGECSSYDWKKHKCSFGRTGGNPQDAFYDDCPLPDVTPIVYGEWIYDHTTGEPFCSECRKDAVNGEITPYCPYCGAKMEEDKEDAKECVTKESR